MLFLVGVSATGHRSGMERFRFISRSDLLAGDWYWYLKQQNPTVTICILLMIPSASVSLSNAPTPRAMEFKFANNSGSHLTKKQRSRHQRAIGLGRQRTLLAAIVGGLLESSASTPSSDRETTGNRRGLCHPYRQISVSCGTAKAFTGRRPSFTSSTFDDDPSSGGGATLRSIHSVREVNLAGTRELQGMKPPIHVGLSGYRFLQIFQHQAYHPAYLPMSAIPRHCGALAFKIQVEAAEKKRTFTGYGVCVFQYFLSFLGTGWLECSCVRTLPRRMNTEEILPGRGSCFFWEYFLSI